MITRLLFLLSTFSFLLIIYALSDIDESLVLTSPDAIAVTTALDMQMESLLEVHLALHAKQVGEL
jgi:hypothetical protein